MGDLLRGAGGDRGVSCAVDGTGHVYMVGRTTSDNGIAMTGAYQSTYRGDEDAFIVKFDSTGQRQWGMYFGTSAFEYAAACALDGS